MKIKIPEGGFQIPLTPPAVYRLRIVGVKVRQSSAGNTQANWECNILSEGPDPKVKTVGKKAFIGTTITEDSLWNLDALLVAAAGSGFAEGQEFNSADEIIAYASARLLNKELIAKCSTEVYEGKPREKWGDYKKVQ